MSCEQKSVMSAPPRAILAVTHNSISNAVKTFHFPFCSMTFLLPETLLANSKIERNGKHGGSIEWIGARGKRKELAIS